jgi:hypothetical protein
MHLKWEQKIMKWVLLASVVIVTLFWAAVEQDVRAHDGQRWTNDGAKAAVERGIEPPHGAAATHEPAPASEDTAKAHAPAAIDSARKAQH